MGETFKISPIYFVRPAGRTQLKMVLPPVPMILRPCLKREEGEADIRGTAAITEGGGDSETNAC